MGACVCGGEIAVGLFLGKLSGLAEGDRYVGPMDLQFGQRVGDHRRPDPVELEDLRVAFLDDHARARA